MNCVKKLVLPLLFAIAIAFGAQVANAQDDSNAAKIEAKETEHDFGIFKESDGDVSHVFVVTNTGKSPLVITRVISSCGCATPSFTKEPIAPGKSGEITVVYNPTGRVYPFTKTISVYSNGKKGPLVLTIKGEVVK
ncbi:MAG: DUF1573 domain-containing protein [Bacteroidales bacterium]|uniref:DUF1573 domain-containing protein n=1 Tax=Porphyromonas sp. TaxID=1924944 RepID=UPI002971B6D5|nr:DUF1573 domain-containing protein [Porphyromonas sp.]MDD7437730.1 DUF1573 domain-containing protein [Bacteroidales bacterium]MDY3066852.1 DUF1573 domain-containing protein [Porphyromonas sp.]